MGRALFSDGANSAFHLAWGLIGSPLVLTAVIGYQLWQGGDNTAVDIAETLIGYATFYVAFKD